VLIAVFFAPLISLACGPQDWPPRVGAPFPDRQFMTHKGTPIRISDFKGKVVIVEPIGMNCPACNAFAGAARRGGFKGVQPQRGVKAFETYLVDYAGGASIGADLVLIQLLLYDFTMGAPGIQDAKMWAEHFGLERRDNVYVVFSEQDLRGDASYNMVPGFQLIDQDSVLRFDSTGHRPQHSLTGKLLPAVRTLLNAQ
jgi:hypothetical protein